MLQGGGGAGTGSQKNDCARYAAWGLARTGPGRTPPPGIFWLGAAPLFFFALADSPELSDKEEELP